QDDRMFPSDAQALYDAARGPRQLWLVPGAAHLEGFALYPQDYEQRVVEFFNRYLVLSMPQGGGLFPSDPEEDY
ncbi:MAG: hypothetical protein JW937_00830, partial [Candidatus Omnitrophica bacterium]|nr:hypothetical protein [Candidatus Omnitrophota bacterium]